jgi:N-methylhydantoinase B
MEAVQAHFQNTANSPIEELETEVPLYVRRYGLVRDSGGAGRSRGGLGVRRDVEFYDHEASFSVLADRARSRPWGLFGGEPGTAARYRVLPADGAEPVALSSKETVRLDPGDTASVTTPGGGGYGDPTERDPERVLADVRDDKVSPAAAREAYGVVVVDGDLDRAATRRLRAARRDEDGRESESGSESEDEA